MSCWVITYHNTVIGVGTRRTSGADSTMTMSMVKESAEDKIICTTVREGVHSLVEIKVYGEPP